MISSVNFPRENDVLLTVRGGGGNFGVITSFKFQAHPVKNIFGGPTLCPIEKTEEIMNWYHGFIHHATEDLNGFVATKVIPDFSPFPEHLHYKQFCAVVWCYAGDLKNTEKVFEPVRAMEPYLSIWGKCLTR